MQQFWEDPIITEMLILQAKALELKTLKVMKLRDCATNIHIQSRRVFVSRMQVLMVGPGPLDEFVGSDSRHCCISAHPSIFSWGFILSGKRRRDRMSLPGM